MVTSTKVVDPLAPQYSPMASQVATLSNILTLGTADTVINTVLPIGYLPPSSRVLDGTVTLTDVDSGAALVIAVGDVADPDRFINGGTLGQAAGTVRFGNNATSSKSFAEHTGYVASTLIQGTVITASGTSVAGTMVVHIPYMIVEPPLT